VSRVRPFGEAAFLVELADAATAQAWRRALLESAPPGVTGLVPGRASLLVEFDPLLVEADDLRQGLEEGPAVRPALAAARSRIVPVVYGGELGPDLPEVASLAGVGEAEVIERHAATEVTVAFLGFAPGFGYLEEVDPALRVPRLATPRVRTPAGSVALADGMTGIYPADLPGGWRIIGRTPLTLFDAGREPPAYLAPGDRVRFEPIPPDAWERHAGVPADW
jgi:KipI family sensor histidine kinase inhibitor